jgi:hypothetical protein
VERYAQQAMNMDAERKACEIRLRAERRWGEMFDAGPKATGAMGNPGGRGAAIVRSPDVTAQPTLAEMGVSKSQASKWQKLAKVPEDQFEDSNLRPGDLLTNYQSRSI